MNTPMPRRLSVLAIAGGGLATLRHREALKLGLPLAAIIAAFWTATDLWPDSGLAVGMVGVELGLATTAMYWQRRVILWPVTLERVFMRHGPDAPLRGRYLLRAVLLAAVLWFVPIIVALVVVPFDLNSVTRSPEDGSALLAMVGVALAVAVVILFAVSRTLLVFPPLTVSHVVTIAQAWRLGRGYGARLATALILLTAPVLIVALVPVDVLPDGIVGMALINGLIAVVRVATALAAAASVAVVYRHVGMVPKVAATFD